MESSIWRVITSNMQCKIWDFWNFHWVQLSSMLEAKWYCLRALTRAISLFKSGQCGSCSAGANGSCYCKYSLNLVMACLKPEEGMDGTLEVAQKNTSWTVPVLVLWQGVCDITHFLVLQSLRGSFTLLSFLLQGMGWLVWLQLESLVGSRTLYMCFLSWRRSSMFWASMTWPGWTSFAKSEGLVSINLHEIDGRFIFVQILPWQLRRRLGWGGTGGLQRLPFCWRFRHVNGQRLLKEGVINGWLYMGNGSYHGLTKPDGWPGSGHWAIHAPS